ncbi:MAG: hypothetical protein R2856_19645 [Caldilineaceae bacterium]
MAQNAQDIADARANGLSEALLDRLLLTPAHRRPGRGRPQGGRTARSGGIGDRESRAAQRHPPQPSAHPHRRARRHLQHAPT